MNLYESITNNLKEAQITDYIPEQKLGQLIKNNPVLGKVVKSYKCLDDMILQVNTDAGVSLYKVVATPDGLEAYWMDKSGKQLGDTFKLTESMEEMDTWVDPRSKVKGWKVKILDVYPDEKGNAVAKVEVFNPEGESTGEETTFINRQKVKIGEVYDAYIDGIMAMPRVMGVDDFDYEDIKGKGKELYEEAIPEDPYAYLTEEELTEAANPENAKVNELIRGSLSSIENAKKNAKKLEKYGIQTKYTTYSDRDTAEPRNLDEIPDVDNDYGNIRSAFLIGPKGRKLKIDSYSSDDVDKVTKVEYKDSLASKQTGHKTDKYDNTLTQKTYKPSKDEVSAAKAELPKLKRRLNLYNRRYGEDHKYTKDLKKEIKKLEDTINKGIVPSRKEDRVNSWSSRTEPISKIHPDADLKNYLDKEPQDTRFEYPAEDAPNPTVQKYKNAKSEERYADQEELRNKEYDKRDQEDINDRIKRAQEDKERRDAYVKDIRDRANADLSELRARIEKMKKRRGN